MESREHEKPQPLDRNLHADLFPTGEFVDGNQELFGILSVSLFTSVPDLEKCIDRDLHDCLEGAIAHWRTRAAGLEPAADKPENPIAAAILERFLERIDLFQKHREEEGQRTIANADILSMLVFLRLYGKSRDNGRSRGRSFLQFIGILAMQFLPEMAEPPEAAASEQPLII